MSNNLLHDGKGFVCLVVATLAAVMLMAPLAVAGPLAADSNAMPGWHGTQFFAGSYWGMGMSPFFNADVDYAVYAPGQFEVTFDGADPSEGVDYVYAYQIFHVGPGTDEPLLQFSVGLDGIAAEGAGVITDFGAGQAPTSASFSTSGNNPPTSAVWYYDSPMSLAPGCQSNILLFTSSAPPEWDTSTLRGTNSTAKTELLPSPGVPEPAMLILIIAAAGVLGASRPAHRPSA
ncbi:MAG: hypothetical protein JW888_05095 [Pirellulales bacterium]|nr:hypothetical protein [Pirellulales bacterium]